MELKRYLTEYAAAEKRNAKEWMEPKNYPIFCQYLDNIIMYRRKGYYTDRETVRLIYNAFSDLQQQHWKI